MHSFPKLSKISRFLGRKTLFLLSIGVLSGIALFFVEIFFAQAIELFLRAIGGTPELRSTTPSGWLAWVPHSTLGSVLLLLGVLGVVRGLMQWAQVYFPSLTAEEQRYLNRSRVLHWGFSRSSVNSGEIVTLFNDSTSGAATAILGVQALAALIPITIMLWIGLLSIAPSPTLISTGCLSLLALGMRALDSVTKRAGQKVAQESSAINNRVLTNIKNLLLMQIYGTSDQEANRVETSLIGYYTYSKTQAKLISSKYAVPQITGVVLICIITMSASKGAERLPPGTLIAYFYLFVRFVQCLAEIMRQLSFVEFYKPHLTRMYQWWESHGQGHVENRTRLRMSPSPLPSPPGWHLRNVTFQYSDGYSPVLCDLTLNIDPGETFVIIGPSGSGKSTLISLLLGNIKPSNGTISVILNRGSETQISQLEEIRSRFLRSVGYVGAESFLIEGTILENLTYGLEMDPPSHEAIDIALRTAECHFVFDLPKGVSHLITEQGQGLSAGQKQRIALARALLRNPRVLILDEATANLDQETEARLVSTLRNLKNRMTIIGVTHRQALLDIADQVLKLEDKPTAQRVTAPTSQTP